MTIAKRALRFAESELREYAFVSPRDFAAALEEFAAREVCAAVLEEREACCKIADRIRNDHRLATTGRVAEDIRNLIMARGTEEEASCESSTTR